MRQIGDFIGGIMGLFFLGAIVYGAFTSGNSTAITVVVILLIIFLIAIFRDNKPQPVATNKTTATTPTSKNVTYDDDYDRFDDRCHHCGGLGWEYYCATCYTRAALEPSTEKYDGDMYCPECAKNGKDYNNIREDLCSVCDGSGKDPDPYYG